jgi:UTP:GlnB (protein PII) uridylyltransferase
MKRDQARRWLEQALVELASARRHLDYSCEQVAGLPETLEGATEKQLESTEAFTGRFARSVDLLVNKVLRSLDRVELNSEGTLLDIINRAEKRGLVDHAEELREMKDVRNMIAHDYAGARAAEIFAWCREQKPVFDRICDRVSAHAAQILSAPS